MVVIVDKVTAWMYEYHDVIIFYITEEGGTIGETTLMYQPLCYVSCPSHQCSSG
jgi:hypothetical protein